MAIHQEGPVTAYNYAELYGELHENVKYFPGYTSRRYVPQMRALCERFKPESIIDYGSGKGFQYLVKRLHEQWGGPLPHCYDIGVRQLAERPTRKFDGLITVDVLEHIAEPDLPAFLADVFSFPTKFAFLAASCRPSKTNFDNGQNLHLTIKPPEWWDALIHKHAPPGLHIETAYEMPA